MFGNAVGEPISCRLANRWWTATCAKAQVTDLTFHDVRHEFGSQRLEAGCELHEVQPTFGHTNIKRSSTYLNATTKGACKKLEAKRRRQDLKVIRPPDTPWVINAVGTTTTLSNCVCNT